MDGFVVMEVSNARAGQPLVVPLGLSGPSPSTPAVSLSEITIESPTDRDRFEVTVSRPAASPDGPPDVERGDALAYVEVSSTPPSDPPVETSIRYDIDAEALPEGLSPEDVRVLRSTDGEWTVDDEEDAATTNREATLPQPGWFAVVALEPGSVEVVDATLEGDWVRSGHETSVRVTARNTGDQTVTHQLAVAVDGEQVAEQNVTVEPGETETVRVPFRPERGGAVTVDGVDAGTIDVAPDDESAPEGDGPRTSDSVPGFGVLAALAALLIAALGGRMRRN